MLSVKKVVTIVLLVGLCSTVAFAAGGREKAAADRPTEILFWSIYGQSPALISAYDETMNRALDILGYDDVSVNTVTIEYSGYKEKYLSAFSAGTGPDLFMGQVNEWALEGGIHPIAQPLPDDLAQLWTENIAAGYKDLGVFRGRRYGFPVETVGSGIMLYYNKDHFRDAGLDPERPPETVDEWIDAMKKTTVYDSRGNITRAGYAPRHAGAGGGVGQKFMAFVYIFGGQAVADDLSTTDGYVNAGGSLRAFQLYYDLSQTWKVSTPAFESAEDTFQQGLAAMIFREGWFAEDTDTKAPNIDYGIAPNVYDPAVGNIAPNPAASGGTAIMINSRFQHKDIAYDLFRELCNVEHDLAIHEPAGYPPVLQEALFTDYFRSVPYADAVVASLQKESPHAPHTAIREWTVMREALGEQVAAAFNGMDPKEAADLAARRMDRIMSEN